MLNANWRLCMSAKGKWKINRCMEQCRRIEASSLNSPPSKAAHSIMFNRKYFVCFSLSSAQIIKLINNVSDIVPSLRNFKYFMADRFIFVSKIKLMQFNIVGPILTEFWIGQMAFGQPSLKILDFYLTEGEIYWKNSVKCKLHYGLTKGGLTAGGLTKWSTGLLTKKVPNMVPKTLKQLWASIQTNIINVIHVLIVYKNALQKSY